jgi:hemerythrin superfamily protein
MANVSRAASKFGEMVGLTGAPVFTEGRNVVDLIIEDHAQARTLYETFKTSTDLEQKKNLRNNIIKSLVQHDECEQLLVYPLLREKVGGSLGEGHYRRSLDEHQELRELLYGVRYLDVNKNPHQFESKFKSAMEAVIRHVEAEENEVLPLLRQHVSEESLKKVGASFVAHKYTAVTRPHPSAPMQGYPAAVANVILKPFDRIQDYWEGVP